MCWGMLSVFCYNTLIGICYITLCCTCSFFWRKSVQDIGSFENGNSVQKKRNETKAVVFTSLKIFPKPAKILHMSFDVNFHPCSIQLKEYPDVYG